MRPVLLDAVLHYDQVCAILSVCGGDRVSLLLDCAEGDRVHLGQQAMFLAIARRMMGNAKPLRRFYARLRMLARETIEPVVLIYLGVAARGLDPAELRGPAQYLQRDVPKLDDLESPSTPVRRASLSALPRRVANEALTTLAALAGGEHSAWRSVTKMRRTRDLYSTRCGREYRILFRFADESLTCEAIIHRRDLETTLATLG